MKAANSATYECIMPTLLLGLYYLFRQSPKQKKALKEDFKSLNTEKITQVGVTRWVEHFNIALNPFDKEYQVFYTTLSNASHETPKTEGLAKLMHDASDIFEFAHVFRSGIFYVQHDIAEFQFAQVAPNVLLDGVIYYSEKLPISRQYTYPHCS